MIYTQCNAVGCNISKNCQRFINKSKALLDGKICVFFGNDLFVPKEKSKPNVKFLKSIKVKK